MVKTDIIRIIEIIFFDNFVFTSFKVNGKNIIKK